MSPRPARVSAEIIRVGQGEVIEAAGVRHVFQLASAGSAGRFGLEEFTLAPESVGARPHIHWAHDECFYVLAGSLTITTDAGEALLVAGDVAYAPRGALHGYSNIDVAVPARALCMYTPAGYEQYFRDVHAASAAGTQLSAELLADLRAHFDTDST